MDFLKYIEENSSYIMNTIIMLIGIIASFLSASANKIVKILGVFLLSILFNVFTLIIYRDKCLLYWTIGLTVVLNIFCYFIFRNKEIVRRYKIDRMIQKFVDDADRNAPICIFGGDLDFFGDVSVNLSFKDKFLKRNKVICTNKQYNQIKNKAFNKIKILNVKPVNENDLDKKTRIRIGYLKEELKDNLEIKFFENKECSSCPNNKECLVCDECLNCSESENCKRKEVHLCDKLSEKLQNTCYNPDIQLRGRIANRKRDNSISVIIVTTYRPGKLYILKEYSSNTKECTIYRNLWEIWWKKCKADNDFINKCIEEYHGFIRGEKSKKEESNNAYKKSFKNLF